MKGTAERRLQENTRSFRIDVPLDYVRTLGLGKGSALRFEILGDMLIYRPHVKSEPGLHRIDLRPLKDSQASTIRRVVEQVYHLGLHRAKILYPDREVRDYPRFSTKPTSFGSLLRRIIGTFPRFAVTREGKGWLIVEQVIEARKDDADKALRRFHLLISENLTDAIQALSRQDRQALDHVFYHDKDEINDLFHLCYRLIRSQGFGDISQMLVAVRYLTYMELFGDSVCDLSRVTHPPSKSTLRQLREISGLFLIHAAPRSKKHLKTFDDYLRQKTLLLRRLDQTDRLGQILSRMIDLLTHIVGLRIEAFWSGDR